MEAAGVHIVSQRMGHEPPIFCVAIQNSRMGGRFNRLPNLVDATSNLRLVMERHIRLRVLVGHLELNKLKTSIALGSQEERVSDIRVE